MKVLNEIPSKNMGGRISEPKVVDANGQVNNNVVVNAMEDHATLLLITAVELGILCLFGAIKLYIYYHCNSLKNLKKKYTAKLSW